MITLALLQFVASAMAAGPAQYAYETRIPAGITDCATEARALGTRFEGATGARVLSATCKPAVDFVAEKNHYVLYPIVLSYSADQPFYPYTGNFGQAQIGTVFPSSTQGIYDSYSDCLGAREAQTRVFERQTGLQAVAAGCEPGFGTLSPNYLLKVDAFAEIPDAYHKAKHHLYAFGYKPIVPGGDPLASRVSELIADQGGEDIEQEKGTFLYYSQYEVRVSADMLASLSSRDECVSQLADAEAIGRNLGSDKNFATCLPMSEKSPEGVNYLQLLRGGGYLIGTDFGTSSRRYYSFQECLNDRSLVLIEARKRNDAVAGGVCHSDDDRRMYVLELFRRI